ncbi:hypothetical protein [Mesorhizobium sp. dw_380]|uniref:hypothetical protein n=1 Tax=Mesorhizobium sp. dw_380 TaxID=2812001 RepID=UPI001BDF38B4|nr:hypothetical protein [Mesorhizobium sp. dw_380]
MDSLTIQDAFEPSGRTRLAAPRGKRLPAKTDHSLSKEQAAIALPIDIRRSNNETDSTTEH